jgi:hypothetical protein
MLAVRACLGAPVQRIASCEHLLQDSHDPHLRFELVRHDLCYGEVHESHNLACPASPITSV